MALNPVTELEALVDALDADGVPYALCGGLALGIHGHPRATNDIDLLVQAADVHRVSVAARSLGNEALLDAHVVECALLDVWHAAERIQTALRRLVVVSKTGLIAMKHLAGGKQDIVDAMKLAGIEDDDVRYEDGGAVTRTEHVDMSPRAITNRLEKVRRLCDLMSYLAQFRPLVEAAENERKAKR
jgi:hypothetical protein